MATLLVSARLQTFCRPTGLPLQKHNKSMLAAPVPVHPRPWCAATHCHKSFFLYLRWRCRHLALDFGYSGSAVLPNKWATLMPMKALVCCCDLVMHQGMLAEGILLQGQSRKRNSVSFGGPRRNSHEGALSMGLPDAEVASSLRSGVDLLKQSLDNGDSSNGDSSNTGSTPRPLLIFVVPACLHYLPYTWHTAFLSLVGRRLCVTSMSP